MRYTSSLSPSDFLIFYLFLVISSFNSHTIQTSFVSIVYFSFSLVFYFITFTSGIFRLTLSSDLRSLVNSWLPVRGIFPHCNLYLPLHLKISILKFQTSKLHILSFKNNSTESSYFKFFPFHLSIWSLSISFANSNDRQFKRPLDFSSSFYLPHGQLSKFSFNYMYFYVHFLLTFSPSCQLYSNNLFTITCFYTWP